jgi:hypothetical protein
MPHRNGRVHLASAERVRIRNLDDGDERTGFPDWGRGGEQRRRRGKDDEGVAKTPGVYASAYQQTYYTKPDQTYHTATDEQAYSEEQTYHTKSCKSPVLRCNYLFALLA